jgi:diguanylate cyclase (GGDEF)-like protein
MNIKTDVLTADEADYGIQASRIFALVLLCINIVFISYFYYRDYHLIVLMDAIFMVIFIALYGLSYTVYALLIKESLMVLSLLQIMLLSVVFIGSDSGMHLYTIGMIPATYIFVSRRQIWPRIRMATLCTLGLVFAETQTIVEPVYIMSQHELMAIKVIVIASVCAIVFSFFLLFFNYIQANNIQLKKLSEIDELTKIANRRLFLQHLKTHTKESITHSVLLIDIDHFKHINDQYGHAGGDEVLKHVSGLMRSFCQQNDIVARLGGEEFAIFLFNTTLMQATVRAENLCKTIEGSPTDTILFSQPIPCTVSIGVNVLTEDIKTSLGNADKAMYSAKVNGRNQVVSIK